MNRLSHGVEDLLGSVETSVFSGSVGTVHFLAHLLDHGNNVGSVKHFLLYWLGSSHEFLGISIGVPVKLTSGILDEFVTFGDEIGEGLADDLSHFLVHVEDILSTVNEVILGLDDVLEVLDFVVPLFAHLGGLAGHGGHSGERAGELVEFLHEGFSFSLVLGNFGFEDTSSNGIADNNTLWATED